MTVHVPFGTVERVSGRTLMKSFFEKFMYHIPVQGNRNKAVDRGRHGYALYISDSFTHEPSQQPC